MRLVLESLGNKSELSWNLIVVRISQVSALTYQNKVAINFEIFGIPYVMCLGIASLCTVYLAKCVGHGSHSIQ